MTENEAIRDLQYLVGEYSAYPPETGVSTTIGSLQYCISTLKEIQQYREIGTVEECREAMEKQKAKKPHRNYEKFSGLWCKCGWYLGQKRDLGIKYCPNCGQAIDVENLEVIKEGLNERNIIPGKADR